MGERFEKIKTRTLTIIIGVPIVLFIIHLGNPIFDLIVALLAIMGSIELFQIFKNKYNPSLILTLFTTIFFLFRKIFAVFFINNDNISFSIMTLMMFIGYFLRSANKKSIIIDISLTLFTAIYIGHFLSFLIDIRNLINGEFFIIFALFTTWMSDASAYIVGTKYGKNHIFPEISPNKTLEGSIGGLIGGTLCGLAFYFLIPLSPLLLLTLGFIAAVFGQLGDLFESIIKRNFGVKDSSKIIPGHGGILDCMDSLLFSVPVLYFFLDYLGF